MYAKIWRDPSHVESIKKQAEQTNLERLGVRFAFNQQHVYEQIQKTHMERYGHKFPLQSKAIQAKIDQTFLMKIGEKRPMSNQKWWIEKIMEKYDVPYYVLSQQAKDHCLEKYGSEFYINSQTSKDHCLEKYGSEFYINSEAYKKYCLEKYGSEHPMQNAEVFYKACKNAFTRKEYSFPSGRKEYILGYEDLCLDYLLISVDENNIIVDPRHIPTFKYEKLRDDGTMYTAKYFPDVLVISDGGSYLIEVKSEWTYKIDTINIHKKIESVIGNGYDIELWIYGQRSKTKINEPISKQRYTKK